MADADGAGHGLALTGQVGQRLQAALGLLDHQSLRAPHRHTGGVIAPVLQAAQPLQQQRRGLLRAYISYDSTHNVVPPDTISIATIKRTNAQSSVIFFSGGSGFVLRSPAYLSAA